MLTPSVWENQIHAGCNPIRSVLVYWDWLSQQQQVNEFEVEE